MSQEIDYSPVCRKMEDLIKDKIEKEGLVETGKLLHSVKVYFKDGNFYVEAEDYFKYLDDKHGISNSIYESEEFNIFMQDFMIKQIENGF